VSTLERYIMYRVSAMMAGGIYQSQTQRVGFTPLDRIKAEFLPWVQVFSTVSQTDTSDYLAHPATGTFRLEIVDVPGNREVVRQALEALEVEFARDQSCGGLCRDISMGPRALYESAENEFSRGAADVTYTLLDFALAATGDVVDVDFAGRASDIEVDAFDVRDVSPWPSNINGGIECQMLDGMFPEVIFRAPGFSDVFPYTLPVEQQSINLLCWIDGQAELINGHLELWLRNSAGQGSGWAIPLKLEWNEGSAMIDSAPYATDGAGFDRTQPLTEIAVRFENFLSGGVAWPTYWMTLLSLSHTAYQAGPPA
jgi:hypothetical protein